RRRTSVGSLRHRPSLLRSARSARPVQRDVRRHTRPRPRDDRLLAAGVAGRVDLVRTTLVALAAATQETDDDRLAASVMTERCSLDVEQYEARERLRDVRIIGSPIQSARQCFDLMRLDTDEDWAVATERM